jgi:hypothetical protein
MTPRQICIAVKRFARKRGDTVDNIDDAHKLYLQSSEYQEMIADMTIDEHRR